MWGLFFFAPLLSLSSAESPLLSPSAAVLKDDFADRASALQIFRAFRRWLSCWACCNGWTIPLLLLGILYSLVVWWKGWLLCLPLLSTIFGLLFCVRSASLFRAAW